MKPKQLMIFTAMMLAFTVIMSTGGARPALAQDGNYQACDDDGNCFPTICDEEEGTCQLTDASGTYEFELWCEEEGECYACDEDDFCLYLYPDTDNADAETDTGDDEADTSDEAAGTDDETAGTGSAAGEGLVADLGFRTTQDDFRFYNYGNEVGAVNLTPAEMQRMFGDVVCSNIADGCTLTPPAKAWMDEQNQGMGGGHCEGLAVLSLLFYTGQAEESEFGADSTFALDIQGNESLQKELAYWWATQMPTYPMITHGTPSELLDIMIESFNAGGSDETYTIGIYKRDRTGGHAVLPYGVEDLGDGKYKVLLYDNNYPGEAREMLIDRNANTWQYEASINPNVEPDLYEGDASTNTLELTPTSVRMGYLPCYFCGEGDQAGAAHGLASPLPKFVEVYVQGPVKLLITDEAGNQMGWKGKDAFVTDIPDAEYVSQKLSYEADWEDMPEFAYRIPTGVNFSIEANGQWLKQGASSALNIIGPGFNLWIDDLYLDPGEKDTMHYTSDPAKQWYELTYSSDYASSPEIGIGLETEESDWEFYVQGADVLPGDEFTVGLDHSEGSFYINTTEAEEWSEYEFHVVEFYDQGEYLYGLDSVELDPDQNLLFTFIDPESETGEYLVEFYDDETGDELGTLALEDKTEQFDEWYYQEPDPTGALYTHPSGAFMVGIPSGWASQEADEGVYFTKDNSVISAFQTPAEEALSQEDLAEMGDLLLAAMLAEAESFEIDQDSVEVEEDSFYLEFAAVLPESEMFGAILMGQDADTNNIYGLVLLTDDMDQVALDWQKVWSTFTANPETTAGVTYIHPTYAFQIDVPSGWIYEDSPAGAVFVEYDAGADSSATGDKQNMIVPFYVTADEIITGENMAAQGQAILDNSLAELGSEVAVDEENVITAVNGFSAPFIFTPANQPEKAGVGIIAMEQDTSTQTVYGLIMLTSDFNDDIAETWEKVANSFTPLAENGETE